MPPTGTDTSFAPPVEEVKDSRRTMSALKASSHIVRAMIVSPGSSADPAARAAALGEMVAAAHASAEKLIDILSPDLKTKGWARSEAFEWCSKLVAAEWMDSHDVLRAAAVIDEAVLEEIRRSIANANNKSLTWMDSVGKYPVITNHNDAASRIRMSLMKASLDLMIEVDRFAFWQGGAQLQNFKMKLIDEMFDFAAEHANKISDAYSFSPEDRIYLWQGDVNRVFNFAHEEYKRQSMLAQAEDDDCGSDIETRRKWFEKAKGGAILKVILSNVSSNMSILDGIADRVAQKMASDKAVDHESQSTGAPTHA